MFKRWTTREEKANNFLAMREKDLRIEAEQKKREEDPDRDSTANNNRERFIPYNQRNDIDLTDVD